MSKLPRYVAQWNGGSGYADPSFDDCERFDSLESVRDAMRARRSGYDTVRPLVGDDYAVSFPAVGDDSEMWVYGTNDEDTVESLRESVEMGARMVRVLRFGPRGGIVTDPYA